MKLVHFSAEGFRAWSPCWLCLRRQTPSQNPSAWRRKGWRGKLHTSTQTQQKRGSATSIFKFFSLHTLPQTLPVPSLCACSRSGHYCSTDPFFFIPLLPLLWSLTRKSGKKGETEVKKLTLGQEIMVSCPHYLDIFLHFPRFLGHTQY